MNRVNWAHRTFFFLRSATGFKAFSPHGTNGTVRLNATKVALTMT